MSAPGDIILETGIDNSKVAQGLNQFEAMINARLKTIQAKMGQLKIPGFEGGALGGMQGAQLGQMEAQFKKVNGAANLFTGSLNRMSSVLSGGLGIGIAIGGLAALEKGFQRAIEKAKQFQTAQLAIAASIQSSYKIIGGNGNELTGVQGFQAARTQAQRLNNQIIQRQAKNILTYQEELGAFQSSVNAGSRKGLTVDQTLKVSESIAIAAKTLGLKGEQLANASRLALGGGVNVGRSTIGRALGISNEDISKRSGTQLVDFLSSKTKGFSAGQGDFKSSIEGILSTLQARVDVFFAGVGEKLFKKIAPSIEKLGAVFESGGADKFADILVKLFNGVFGALQSIAQSPAIPLIMKFLEFLGNYGDKLLIIGAFSKLTGIIGGLVGNVRLFTSGLGAMADKALFGAAALEKEAVAAQGLNAATGGGVNGITPGVSRGLVGASSAEAAALNLAAPGTGGITNFPWYASRYKNAQLSHANRALGDASFDKFAQNASFIPNATNAKETAERVAKAEAQAKNLRKAEAAERRASFFEKAGLGGGVGHRLGTGAMYAGLAFMGSELVKTQTDQSSNEYLRFGGGALQAGATTGAGLAGAGLLSGPVGIAATAFASVLGGLNSALGQLTEQANKATSALESFATAHPQAAKISALKQRSRQLDKNVITSHNDNDAETNFWAGALRSGAQWGTYGLLDIGDYTGDTQTQNLLTNRTKRGLPGTASKKILEQQNIGRATYLNDTKQKDIESTIQSVTKQIASEQLGFGNHGTIEERTLALNKAKIQDAALKNDLYIDPLTQKRAQGVFNQAERNRTIFKAIAPNTPLSDTMLKNGSLDQTAQNLKADQLTKEAETKYANDKRTRVLQQQGFIGGLNPNRITGEFNKGLADAEASIRQRRAEFDMPDKAFEHLVETVKQKFVTDFDLPTKKAEAAIQALNLGGTPEELTRVVGLTIQTTEAKIDKLAKDLNLSASEVAKLKVDAARKIQGEHVLSLLSGGGLSINEQVNKSVRGKRNELRDLLFQQQSSIGDRGITLEQRSLQDMAFAKAGDRIATQQSRLQEDHPLNSADAQLGLQSATINARKAQLAPTLDASGPFSDAASAIRYKVDSERGFDPGKYESAYRESKSLQDQEAEMAKQSTEIARQRASLNLARTEEDYKTALSDLTSAIQERVVEQQKTLLDRGQQDYSYTRGQEQSGEKISEVAGALGRAGSAPQGGIPGVDVPLRGGQGGVSIPAPGGGSSPVGGGLSLTIPISILGLTKEEIEKDLSDELHKRVPPIIDEWAKNKTRKPH